MKSKGIVKTVLILAFALSADILNSFVNLDVRK